MTTINQTFRVIRLTEAQREAIRDGRIADDTNNAGLLKNVVDAQLPKIVETLKTLGFSGDGPATRPYRLPFHDETLAALKLASEEVGVPAAHLLLVCLAPIVAHDPKPAKAVKAKRAPKKAAAKAKATKAAKPAGRKAAKKGAR